MTYFSHGPVEHRGKSLAAFSAALLGGQALGPAVSGARVGYLTGGVHRGRRRRRGRARRARLPLAAARPLAARRGPQPTGRRRRGGTSPPRPDRPDPAGAPLPRLLRRLLRARRAAADAAAADRRRPLPAQAGVVGLLLGVGGICRFVGAAVGGVVADRYSRKAALVPSLLAMGGAPPCSSCRAAPSSGSRRSCCSRSAPSASRSRRRCSPTTAAACAWAGASASSASWATSGSSPGRSRPAGSTTAWARARRWPRSAGCSGRAPSSPPSGSTRPATCTRPSRSTCAG